MTNEERKSSQSVESEEDKKKVSELLAGWNLLSQRSARLDLLEAQLTALAEEISHVSNMSAEERVRLGKLSSLARALTGE